jgi:hypothetical protein
LNIPYRILIKQREAHIKLQTTEEKIMAQEQSLIGLDSESTLQEREFSSSMVISLAVGNAMALVKNHVPEFDAEILQKDLVVDDAG